MKDLSTILKQFDIKGTVSEIKPLGNGLINDTYKVTTQEEDAPDYVLQRSIDISHGAVIIGIVSCIKGMPPPALRRILLRRASCKARCNHSECYQKKELDGAFAFHVFYFIQVSNVQELKKLKELSLPTVAEELRQ